MAIRRLALFIDGTWNTAESNTNVLRLYNLTANQVTDPFCQQIRFYHVGVGTNWHDHVRGAFGKGINTSIRNCYQWLAETYQSNDKIFIFGFSRGAFIARSLTGFIDRMGLIYDSSSASVSEAFELYRGTTSPIASEQFDGQHNLITSQTNWARVSSRPVEVDFLGVWDTVRYYDVPLGSVRGLSRAENLFHFIQPGRSVRRLYQALAIDEQRAPYRPELWRLPGSEPDERQTTMEQRWFTGVHSNIGGGYKDNALSDLALEWMQRMAEEAGLGFTQSVSLSGLEHLAPIVDSYSKFLGGTYRFIPGHSRYIRPLVNFDNHTEVTNQVIDGSVFERWRALGNYRPPNVESWATSRGLAVGELYGQRSL
ncbi:uncharacterized protein (DUF2235 family) [Arthrobacter pascens]|uniref:DUF2235 domain-containing protein n=1 Tax=Arthrobacter pascens TaxID=1677 RepID=UPI00285F7C31|nr:DUF2235 domain-containing protein [Arthrobacter pascens]MDR6558428.1 uncharacterized protein (DUF2235 family) [Arthrobacter pascens]